MSDSFPVVISPRVALIHPGVQHSGQLAEQLERTGLLGGLWTGVGVSDRGLLGPWLRRGTANRLARGLGRRVIRGVPAGKVHLHPWPEVLAGWRRRACGDEQVIWHRRNGDFQRALHPAVFQRHNLVVGFDTSAWLLGGRCAAAGTRFVLDQTIAHPVAKMTVYEELRRRYPEWADNLETRLPEVIAAETEEQRAAVRIVAASSFTRRSLIAQGVAAEKVVVNPYGVDLTAFAPKSDSRPGPLRFVFAGSVGARKGIPLLLEAWHSLDTTNAELLVVGHVAPRFQSLVTGHRNVRIEGNVSHQRMAELLRECDVFVFPSYFEGFGLVLLEAMACGLPAIATDATAGPDILTDGVDGFVIQAGDGAALKARMEIFLRDPARARSMGRAARAKAEKFTWDAYGDRWAALVRELCPVPVAS